VIVPGRDIVPANLKMPTSTPGGGNPSLGRPLEELAALQQSYVASLDSDVQQWPSTERPRDGAHSTSRLHERFNTLDVQMESAVSGFSRDVVRDVKVTRPDGSVRTRDEQVEIYSQAMFIFLGKAVVYCERSARRCPRRSNATSGSPWKIKPEHRSSPIARWISSQAEATTI
jgi:hypothetical protein